MNPFAALVKAEAEKLRAGVKQQLGETLEKVRESEFFKEQVEYVPPGSATKKKKKRSSEGAGDGGPSAGGDGSAAAAVDDDDPPVRPHGTRSGMSSWRRRARSS